MRTASPGVALAAALLLGAGAASAHDADIIYTQARRGTSEAPGGPEVRQVLTLTAATLALLLPPGGEGVRAQADLDARGADIARGVWDRMPLRADGQPCVRAGHEARLRDGFVELRATFTCPPGALRQRYGVLAVLPSGYRVVLGSVGGGEAPGALFADATRPSLDLPADGAVRPGGGFGGWVVLGAKHIIEGWDHLAFLLAVLLVGGGTRRVLLLVTSFTVAHSLTLAATALGWVGLGSTGARWVEAAIALSIIYVAVENLIRREHRHRALVTFLFGLVHGFGFASMLARYGLGDAVVVGLLGFNLGVELGQAAVVLALLPVLRIIQRRPALHRKTVRGVSAVLLLIGAFGLVDRALG